MSWALALSMGVLAAVNPCAPISPLETNAGEAAAYVSVARAEEAAGRTETALEAWAQALVRDGSREDARAALERACAEVKAPAREPDADLTAGLGLLEAGRVADAAARFEASLAKAPSLPASLLLGVCRFRLRDFEAAEALLRKAREAPELAPSADVFLGLIALEQGRAADADARLRAVADDALVGPLASGLLPVVAREGRLTVAATAEAGADSNASLTPGASLFPPGAGDLAAGALVELGAHPLGRSGPYAVLTGGYRANAHLWDWNAGLASGALGWQLVTDRFRGLLEYRAELDTLGAGPSLVAQALCARASWRAGAVLLSADYLGRLEVYQTAALAPFSGQQHAGRAHLGWVFPGGSRVELGYVVRRVLATTAELSSVEQGPDASGLVFLRPDLRLLYWVGYRARTFDAIDPDFGLVREETELDASVRVELDLAPTWTAFVRCDAHSVAGNVPELLYSRVAMFGGVVFSSSLL